jgi:hypothetical protein
MDVRVLEQARSRMRFRPEPHSSLFFPVVQYVHFLVSEWIQKSVIVVVLEGRSLLEAGLAEWWVAEASVRRTSED